MSAEFAVPAPFAGRPELVQAGWTAAELAAVAGHLAERGGAALASVPLPRRVEVWLEVVEALLEPASPERRSLLPGLVATSRLSAEGLSEALEVVVGGAGRDAVDALLARLPESPPTPYGLAGVVLAANVPGLAVQTVLPALLLGRPLLLKSSVSEPLFAPALVAALARREPALADAFAAVAWPGGDHGDEALESAAFARAGRVLAYGGSEAIAGLSERLGDRLVAHGPKASVALVAGAHDPLRTARGLARDVALLDQRGCLSVQAVFLVGDESAARALGEALAFALEIEHRRIPPGPIEPSVAAAVHQLRGEAELTGRRLDRLEIAAGTVLLDPDPALRFRPVPGLRTVRLHPAPSIEAVAAALTPQRARLQGLATAGDATTPILPSFNGGLSSLSSIFSRIAPAGRLQHAEAGWASGGLDPLAALAQPGPASSA